MGEFVISEVEEADMPEIFSLAIKVSEKHVFLTLSEEGKNTIKHTLRNDIRGILDKEVYQALKIKMGSKIVGYIAWRHGQHIEQLYVDSIFQYKGIGTLLLNEVKQSASGSILKTNASLNAVQFYLKNGFVPMGRESEINGIKYLPMEYTI